MSSKNRYELMVMFRGDLAETEVKKEIAQIKKDLTDLGAETLSEEYWGRKNLVYKVGQGYSGYLSFLKLALGGKEIESYKVRLSSNERIVRQMITKVGE